MTVTARNLVPAKLVENTQTTQYIVPTNATVTIIDKFTATNVSGSTATISVYLVTSLDTAGNQNLVVKTVSILAGATYTFPEIVGHVLNSGGFVSTIAGTANAISIRASGREVT